ncbi:hypothetical protein R6Q57_027730 [Mikania cordata]
MQAACANSQASSSHAAQATQATDRATYLQALKAHIGNPDEIGTNTCIDRGRSIKVAKRRFLKLQVQLAAAGCVTKDIFKPGDYGSFLL